MDKPKVKRCDLNICEAMCCYDGVYLEEGEEQKIKEVVSSYPSYFAHLPSEYIVDGQWKGLAEGRKTATTSYSYQNPNYPVHFEQTRCVFATPEHFCSLQLAAAKHAQHPWDFKPRSCWMFPLHERKEENGKESSLVMYEEDPYKLDDTYQGFVSYTSCGKHVIEGEIWEKTLAEEINYYQLKKR